MATFWYNSALSGLVDRTLDLTAGTFKLLLVTPTYTPNRDHTVVNNGSGTGSASNPRGCELNQEAACDNYVRKSVTLSSAVVNANDRVNVALTDASWTALGGVNNQTVRRAILFKDLGGLDTSNPLIACFDIDGPGGTGITTNGGDLDLDAATLGAGGNLRITSA